MSADKSIYSVEPTPTTLIPLPPTRLQSHIKLSRELLQAHAKTIQQRANETVQSITGFESTLEQRIKSLEAKDEALSPGLLYIGVATLGASILARNRPLLLRPLLPLSFFYISALYCLPKTTAQVESTLASLEATHFPEFAKEHTLFSAKIAREWTRAKHATEGVRGKVEEEWKRLSSSSK